jgi:hypothetical protein
MWQDALVYAIVAIAATWVAWSVLLPSAWRAPLRACVRRALGCSARVDTRDGCGCAGNRR